jgi:two-component system KDP operon response regulator KdpE
MLFLIISSDDFLWREQLQEQVADVLIAADEDVFRQIAADRQVDVILYHSNTFDRSDQEALQQVKLRCPQALLVVFDDDVSLATSNKWIEAGASDILVTGISDAAVLQHLLSFARQREASRDFAARIQSLHTVSRLSQQSYSAKNPADMINHAIEMICYRLDVYGVAIVLDNGSHRPYKLYAGTRDMQNGYPYTVDMSRETDDPIHQVITTNVSLLFEDITEHPYYTPIPVIPAPRSAIIVPMSHANRVIGALALFSQNRPFTASDVAIFSILATNISAAYHSVDNRYWHERDVQAMRYMLRAWPNLNKLHSVSAIAQTLHDHVLEIETINVAGVWLFGSTEKTAVVYSKSEVLQNTLEKLLEEGVLQKLQQEFDRGLQPITLHRGMTHTDMQTILWESMETEHITLVPVTNTSFEGILFVAEPPPDLTSSIDLCENLARITANVLERNTLINFLQDERHKLQEQTRRVEIMLQSIAEGIFFVNTTGEIIYCNPQFSELTGIKLPQVLNRPFPRLFQQLAQSSVDRHRTYEQLMRSAQQLQTAEFSETHPIIEITTAVDTTYIVEFMDADRTDENSGWIGIVHQSNSSQSAGGLMDETGFIQSVIENMSFSLIELDRSVKILPDQYDLLSAGRFESLIHDLDHQVYDIRYMLQNASQIFRQQISSNSLDIHRCDFAVFMMNLLSDRRLQPYYHYIESSLSPDRFFVHLDERQMRRCIVNVFKFIYSIDSRAPVILSMAHQDNQAILRLRMKTIFLSDEMLDTVFNLVPGDHQDDKLYPYQLGMYLARQIIASHEGQLVVESSRPHGTVIELVLPAVFDNPLSEGSSPGGIPATSYKPGDSTLTLAVLESTSSYMSSLYPRIQLEGHQTLIESQFQDILFDLRMTRVDICVLEFDQNRQNILDCVTAIRAISAVPVFILALPRHEDLCLKAMDQGADDYLIMPFNNDKFMALLHSLANRQHIVARTSEPVTVGNLTVDFSRRRVHLNNQLIELTKKEYELLRVLVTNRGQVMQHEQLLSEVWGPEYKDEKQYLWVNISRLRRKLEPEDHSPRYIQNEPSVGYVFVSDE